MKFIIFRILEENTRIMERRSDVMKESTDNARKQLTEALDEKNKLEKELSSMNSALSETKLQIIQLNKTISSQSDEIALLKVKFYLNYHF